jgi:hypothetical protein
VYISIRPSTQFTVIYFTHKNFLYFVCWLTMSISKPSSPRPRLFPSTTATPLLSPTGPPCTKSSRCDANQASVILSKFSTRNKARTTQNTPAIASSEQLDYFSSRSFEHVRKPMRDSIKEGKEPNQGMYSS